MPRRFLRGAARGAVAAGAVATRRGAGSGEARLRDADDDAEDEEAGFRTGAARIRRGWPADLAGAGTGLKNLESSWSMVLKDRVRGPPSGLISRGGKAGRDEAAATEEEEVEEEEEAAGSSCKSSGRESSRSSSKVGAGFAGLSISLDVSPLGAFHSCERGS